MKNLKAGVATVCIGLLAASAVEAAPEVNVTNNNTYGYGEIQIAVNPKNPNNIVFVQNRTKVTAACVAAKEPLCLRAEPKPGVPTTGPGAGRNFPQGYFTGVEFTTAAIYASMDGGKTWKPGKLQIPSPQYPELDNWGDPSVAVMPDGTFYFSYNLMDWGTPENVLPKSIVGMSKSTDGGLTWTAPVATGTGIDGPKSVIDPNTSTIYEGSGAGNRRVTSSKDGVTFTKPNGMGGTDGTKTYNPGMGTTMAAAGGKVAVAFRHADAAACEFFVGGAAPCLVFQTSADAGTTWQRYRVPVTGPAGATSLAADPSKKDHFTLAVQNTGASQFNVYQTTDGGKTWTGPTTLADQPGQQYFHAWANYSSDGVFGLIWRIRPRAPEQAPAAPGAPAGEAPPLLLPYSVWGAISRDGGATFSEPLKVAESPAPRGSSGGDDYSSIAIAGGKAHFAWADWRTGERQGFFRAVDLKDFKFTR